jgi:hypothetical protein
LFLDINIQVANEDRLRNLIVDHDERTADKDELKNTLLIEQE